ncbi:MAG TPA: carboxypeptidase-like regulatory domain-containing protein [Anaerolineae bacterium]|jgi:hypothetical protein
MRQHFIRAFVAVFSFIAFGLPQAGLAHGSGVQADFMDWPTAGPMADVPQRPVTLSSLRNNATAPLQSPADEGTATALTCTKLTASSTTWFAADASGNVDTSKEVDTYPTGATVLAPGFQFACAPKDVDIVVIIYNESYGDQPALVEKRTLRASPTAGVFFYGLTTPDGSALQDGKWRVAFYLGKTPLTTGEVLVGGATSMDVTLQALLQGTVTDLRTGQPVAGARVFVLNPGVTIANFTHQTRSEDIFVQTRSDDQGQFALWKPLQRDTAYAVLIAADGYRLRGANNLTIGDDATSPVALDIQVIKK